MSKGNPCGMNTLSVLTQNTGNEPLTMSSREIAELTEKQHAHVIRDIRSMIEALGDDPDLDHLKKHEDSRGYTSEIDLPKGLTLTLIAGYSIKLRKRIIDRWQELEAAVVRPVLPDNLSRLQLIQIALQAEQERLVLEAKADQFKTSVC